MMLQLTLALPSLASQARHGQQPPKLVWTIRFSTEEPFIKLQDALGERLLPATLSELRAPFEEWPMRDRLDRLERLGYIAAAGELTDLYRAWKARLPQA